FPLFPQGIEIMNQPNPIASAPTTRRRFLQQASAAGAAGLLVPHVHAWGQEAAGEEKLNLAIIGAGGRGQANTGGVSSENIYALCDVNRQTLEAIASKHFPQAKTFTDWREVIDEKNVDAVVISTADHHHAPAALAAMRAGKH